MSFIGEPDPTLGSSPRAGFRRDMRYGVPPWREAGMIPALLRAKSKAPYGAIIVISFPDFPLVRMHGIIKLAFYVQGGTNRRT